MVYLNYTPQFRCGPFTVTQMLLSVDLVGPWLPWSQWSSCSVSCGGGQQARSRLCSSLACHGLSRQSKTCNTQVCLGQFFLYTIKIFTFYAWLLTFCVYNSCFFLTLYNFVQMWAALLADFTGSVNMEKAAPLAVLRSVEKRAVTLMAVRKAATVPPRPTNTMDFA